MDRRSPPSPVLVLAAVVTVGLYATAAFLVWQLLLFVWRQRPDPVTTILVVVGVTIAFGYASYRFGTSGILRSLGAEPLAKRRAPALYRRVGEFAAELGIDTPTICIARMDTPNALALGGPTDGVVVLDTRLFRLLSARELDAIIAHELAHLKARDGLIRTLGASLVSTVAGLLALALLPAMLLVVGIVRAFALVRGRSDEEITAATTRARMAVGSLAVLLLFALTIVLRAYSRRRELAADDTAATLTGDPAALASALARIKRTTAAEGLLSSLYIHGDETGTLTRLLSTHPPMDERVERLRARAASDEQPTGSRRIPIQ